MSVFPSRHSSLVLRSDTRYSIVPPLGGEAWSEQAGEAEGKDPFQACDMDFDDLRSFLQGEGWNWQAPRSGGSHHRFWKVGERVILSIPTVGGRKVKRTYIALVVKTLGLQD